MRLSIHTVYFALGDCLGSIRQQLQAYKNRVDTTYICVLDQVAACDTDNHVLLFKHSVDVPQSGTGEESSSYRSHEVSASFSNAQPSHPWWFLL